MSNPSVADLFDLKDRVAVVTGGAGGICQAIALRLSEAGASVVVADVNIEAAESIAEQLHHNGAQALAIKIEVGGAEAANALIRATIEAYGRLDIFINGAGGSMGQSTNALTTDEASWDLVHNVNLRGAFFCAQAAARAMIGAGRGGRIINIASIEGIKPLHEMSHYSAAKAGMISLTQSLAKQLAEHGILVNTVAPGGVITPAAERFVKAKGLDVEVLKTRTDFTNNVLLGRWADPDEIARVVLFLAGRGSDYITGSTIVVDGGCLLS